MNNREIAETFELVADMLAIRGDQIHRVLAYRRAAENIRELNRELSQIQAEGGLTNIPGIGATLAAKIEEMLTTNRLEFFDRVAKDVPPSLAGLLRIEGLGPKRVKQLYDTLGITTLEELEMAANEGKLRGLPGLGAKSETKIIAAIQAYKLHGDDRILLGDAWPIAQRILEQIQGLQGVKRAAVAGSLRRMRETIGDIDIFVAADNSEPIMSWFRNMENVETVLGSGQTKTSVVLLNGLQVDLRVLPAERWGTLLSYFTGSKNHNVRLRELALQKGLSLNEHAFTPIDGGAEILCDSEEQVYATLNLPYISPVLREDRGEIEVALEGNLPKLIQLSDIVADLHIHTTWSDGKLGILDIARAAKGRGYQHIVVSDHSLSLGIANGLTVDRLMEQANEIHSANQSIGSDFHILHGTEMEIKANGELDYPDEVLAGLDFVIASLHVGLRQPREQIMTRLMNAVENPHVDMIAHPTGRLLPDRQPADIDMAEFLMAAARTGTILEINANPQRLDLRDSHVRQAKELGVKIAINTDAHDAEHFNFLHFGVATAQRGWLTPEDVVNTWATDRLMAYVRRNG